MPEKLRDGARCTAHVHNPRERLMRGSSRFSPIAGFPQGRSAEHLYKGGQSGVRWAVEGRRP